MEGPILDFTGGDLEVRGTGRVVYLPEIPTGVLQIDKSKYLAVCGVNTYFIETGIYGETVTAGNPTVAGEYISCGSGKWCFREGLNITFCDEQLSATIALMWRFKPLSKRESMTFRREMPGLVMPQFGISACSYCRGIREKGIMYPFTDPKLLFMCNDTIYIQGTDSNGEKILSSIRFNLASKELIYYCSWNIGDIGGGIFYRTRDRCPQHDKTVVVSFLDSRAKSAMKS